MNHTPGCLVAENMWKDGLSEPPSKVRPPSRRTPSMHLQIRAELLHCMLTDSDMLWIDRAGPRNLDHLNL